MQHDKNTKEISQIQKVAEKSEEVSNSIFEVVGKFTIKERLKKIDPIKRSGALISTVIITLLILPFVGVSSVLGFIKSDANRSDVCGKDSLYDVKNNPRINWRNLLIFMAKRFNYLLNVNNVVIPKSKKTISEIIALILDDSILEKSGKYIEGVGYVYNHCSNLHVLGFKLLVLGFWDGKSFIPIDFSLHRETRQEKNKKLKESISKKDNKLSKLKSTLEELKKKRKKNKKEVYNAKKSYDRSSCKTNKEKLDMKNRVAERIKKHICKIKEQLQKIELEKIELENEYFELKSKYSGLTRKEKKKQFKKQRNAKSHGSKRFLESSKSKMDISVKMLRRAVKHGFVPDYVLTDSWFFCKKILDVVIDLGRSIDLISMAKIGRAKYRIISDNKFRTPHEIIALYNRKNGHNSRKYKAKYIELIAEYQGIKVKIFLIKFGTYGTWRMLVTTDLQLSFTRIIEIYKIRWTIEVFFRECKQYLLLGKSQSRDFDAQIADTTLSLMRYILLSYYKRIHYGMTIGGAFRELSQNTVKENLLTDINYYFNQLLEVFAEIAGIDFITFYEGIFTDTNTILLLQKMGIKYKKNVA